MRRALRLLAPLLALLFVVAGATVGSDHDADSRLATLAAAAGQGQPRLRIGLEPVRRVVVSSDAPFRLLDVADGKPVWHGTFERALQVIAEGGPIDGPKSVFRLQVGAFGERDAAERELERLRGRFAAEGVIYHDADRGNWRVRMGRADKRLALNPLLERMRAAGMRGMWIAEEPAESVGPLTLRLVDAAWNDWTTDAPRLVAVPADDARIVIDGTAYRGVVELRVTAYGTVRPINWVELEQYLLGVVPAELGPEVWPELAALQAQAVAARTYVWRNRGQFLDEGFDLCATPRCQVYKGADAEHPLSDRAVRNTRGEVLFWNDEPIVALYTATCGGHTEDGGAIFPEHAAPYLSGVPCRAEGAALEGQRSSLRGRAARPVQDETGADVTRDWNLLAAAGVIAPDASADVAGRPISGTRLRTWTTALARLAGLPPPQGPPVEPHGLGPVAVALLDDLAWTERADVLLSGADLAALLRDDAALALDAPERRALGYLALVEAVKPFPEGAFRVEQDPTAARMAPALARIGERYEAFGLESATVAGRATGALRLVRGKGEIRLPLADRPRLFGYSAGRPVAVDRLDLWPGDRIRYRRDTSGRIDFVELQPPVNGLADDRSSRVSSWEVRRSRRELEVAINRHVEVGRLRDLRVLRRGVSGRVVELEVVGSKVTTVVRGFDVRRLLDLRESLLVMEIQRNADGAIEAVVFAGKGWGHGAGLCQVGAYGMALRGVGYREILAHYYRGATLRRLAAEGS